METVLVVEDSRLFGSVLKKQIEANSGFSVEWLKTFATTKETIERGDSNFSAALLDLNLPDAPNGEIVDLVLDLKIPVIVFTGDMSDEARDYIWSKKVAEYVLKEDRHSIDYIINLLNRLQENVAVKILIVDDSRLYRKIIRDLLQVHQYQTLEATNGSEALEILAKEEGITMVITDYNMPLINGVELVKRIRDTYSRDELSILALSTEGNTNMSAQFIKSGANDFLNKPFGNEEFYCRVTQAIVMMDNIKRITNLSNKDPMTDLYNRRFFFEAAPKSFASAKRKQITISVAMLDIDFFKKVNDTYGHDVGDEVIKHLATALHNRFRQTDIVARFGGEEFCVMSVNMDKDHAFSIYEKFRQDIAESELNIGDHTINYNVSIGVCCHPMTTIDEMIKQADLMLYEAKDGGRNRVVIAQEI